MDKSELKGIIADQRKAEISEELIERAVLKKITELKKTPFVIIVSGVRRCGKSTLLNQIRKVEDGYYFNFDDDRIVDFKIEDFQTLYELFLELEGEKNIFYLDEIQNIKGWELFARRLRDSKKKVYITGSNASMLSKELGTHLTGRYVQLTLYPFSFFEFLLLKHVEYSKEMMHTTTGKGKLKRLFNEFLENGGIPEYLKTGNKEYLKTLYENILYRDVLVRYKLTNEKTMKELVHFIASNIAKEISFNSLKKMLGLGSSTTVKEYFDYLENSFLLFLVPRFSYSLKKQIYASKKAYFIDTALALNVGYRLSEDKGRMLENIVFLELKRKGKEVYYHKEKYECDFIIRKGYKITEAMQVTTSLKKNEEREYNGLLEAMKKHKLKSGLMLTEDEESERVMDNKKIKIMPIWKWLLI